VQQLLAAALSSTNPAGFLSTEEGKALMWQSIKGQSYDGYDSSCVGFACRQKHQQLVELIVDF
jgi:hypothetical protein